MSNIDTQGMSPEEAALSAELDGDGLPPEMESEVANREALQRPAGLEEQGEDDPAAAPAPAPAAAPAPAPAPAAAAPAPAPAADAPAAAPAPAPAAADTHDDDATFQAPYNVDVPADAQEQLTKLRTEESEAFAKLMAGEMESDAYLAIKAKSLEGIREIENKLLTAQVLTAANEQQAANEWKRSQTAAFAAFKGEGIDYMGKPALLAAYNVNLKALAAKPENESRSSDWFLREAHKLTKADLGITAAPTPAPAPAPAPAQRGVDRSKLPPTLAQVPVAADPTVAGDEFAHMAHLSGAEAERAFAAMTPEQQDRYLD